MNGQARHGSGPPGRVQLSTSGRSARRAARRRQIRRRRATALGIIALAVAGLVVLVMPGGSHPASRPAAAPASLTPVSPKPAGQPRPVIHKPHPGPPPAGSQAAPVDRVLRYTSYVELAGHRHRDVALT